MTSLTIREFARTLDELPWRHFVYLPPGLPSLDTTVMILDPSDAELDQDVPRAARDAGLEEGVSVADARSIRENARLQGKAPTEHEFLEALAYYLSHDAFIEFDS